MRPLLKWALGLSTGASAIALMWPIDKPYEESIFSASLAPASHSANSTDVFPEKLPEQILLATKNDPFVSTALVQPLAAPVVLPTPQPEPIRTPPLSYRYLGSVTGPQGDREIYLSNGSQTVAARQGVHLGDGYTIETMGTASIKVLHSATQARVDIPIVPNKE